MPPTQGPENFMNTDEIIGICIAITGVTICIIRLLCIKQKKGRKRKDPENSKFRPDELPVKRTAADHLLEIKEATQKAVRSVRSVRSLSVHSPKESRTPLDNSSLFSSQQKQSSPINSTRSTRSSKSFSRKVESRLSSHKISKNNSKYSSRVVSLRRSSLTIKPQFKRSPPTPPPSPLKFQDDIIEVDPMRLSLINTLLSNIYTLPSSSKTSSHEPSKVQSRIESQIESIQSRTGSRTSSNSSISSQSTSSSQPSSRIST